MKKTYIIPCTWTVAGEMAIEAESLEDAIFEAENNAPLPTDTSYIEGSFEVNNQMIPWVNKDLNKDELDLCKEVIRF